MNVESAEEDGLLSAQVADGIECQGRKISPRFQ